MANDLGPYIRTVWGRGDGFFRRHGSTDGTALSSTCARIIYGLGFRGVIRRKAGVFQVNGDYFKTP